MPIELFYDESQYSNILPEGKYECTVNKVTESTTKGGTLYINVEFIIRKDVAQKYGGKHIFYPIFQRKKEKQTKDDEKVNGFSYKMLMNLCRAAGLQSGTKYKSLNELFEDLKGKNVNVQIEHDEYNGAVQEKVKYVNAPQVPSYKTNEAQQTPVFDADDDLPFE